MAPAPTPTKNKPVTLPVIIMRRSARLNVVGNIEAINRPRANVLIQIARIDFDQIRMMAMLAKQPKRSVRRIVRGLYLVAIGIDSNLPSVSAPQKAAVKYAAEATLLKFNC